MSRGTTFAGAVLRPTAGGGEQLMDTALRQTPESGEREAARLRAVESVLLGERPGVVARRFGVTRQALHTWLRRHGRLGVAGLVSRRCGRAARRILDPGAEAGVIETILARPPRGAGLPQSCWTRNAVVDLVEELHGVRPSHWQVDRMLRRWGFRAHKEVRNAHRLRPAAVLSRLAAARAAADFETATASPGEA